jgi:hypothetical protein
MNQTVFLNTLRQALANRKTYRGVRQGDVLAVRTSSGVISPDVAVERYAGAFSPNAALQRNLSAAITGQTSTPAQRRFRSQLAHVLGC